ncbi:MAG TPA: hypothetical protein VFT55_01785 [Planctomycetota bacterium]|nr:hypothetical protein [Planctomycetota bacterium]
MQRKENAQNVKLNPYLTFNGQCETALEFYEKGMGGRIDMMISSGSRG